MEASQPRYPGWLACLSKLFLSCLCMRNNQPKQAGWLIAISHRIFQNKHGTLHEYNIDARSDDDSNSSFCVVNHEAIWPYSFVEDL